LTASDVLWSGVPIVTALHDPKFSSRVAGSLLKSLDVPELIVYSWQDYEDLAVKLATDKDFYTSVRSKLQINRDSKDTFKSQVWIKHFELALEKMWENHLAGNLPRDITMSLEEKHKKDEL
jgi:protein O-GlcNAc transferase